MLTALPAVAAYAGDVKNCWILQAHCGMLCAYQEEGGKIMRCQRKQDMRRGSTGGRLPFGELAFSIQMTLAAK